MMKIVQFYFDPISPYCWLAAAKLTEVEKAADICFEAIPVLFAGLLNYHENKGPAEVQAKRSYMFTDVIRLAQQAGLDLQGPPSHPFNPLKALRSCLAIEDLDLRKQYSIEVMHSAWRDGKDITEEETLQSIAHQCGLDGDFLIQQTQEKTIKAKLLQTTQKAITKGIFGVPTFVVKNDLFWGYDRLSMLQSHLCQEIAVDPNKIQQMLQRPSSAKR
jgi:2-hydroxychromene-2-carboxylate isomerase